MEMGLVNGEVESKEDFKKRKTNEKKEARLRCRGTG